MATIDEVTEGIYRIATFDERTQMSFNQYLIRDDKTALIHTGSILIYDGVIKRIREVTNPDKIDYVFISHFEADECGALAPLRQVAEHLIPVGSAVTARQLKGFGICDNTLVQKEGDTLALGRRRLSFITYPSEMHLWDGLLAFLEPERILFSSDLFIRRGPTPAPVVDVDAQVLDIPMAAMPSDEARHDCLVKIKALDARWLALGHGPVLHLPQ